MSNPKATLLEVRSPHSSSQTMVLHINRPHPEAHSSNPPPPPTRDLLTRRKCSIAVDLKPANGLSLVKYLLKHVDVLIDPFRPGALESLSQMPAHLLASNPRLIIARLTGLRRDASEYSRRAGHNINYLALSGGLYHSMRKDQLPHAPPISLPILPGEA